MFSATCDVSYSNAPTEIKLSLVLEAEGKSQFAPTFDIRESDLKIDAGKGGEENLYDIDFNGVRFNDFVLYDYSLSVEAQVKILTVTFKDYSVILDKIYVGLIKRQGNTYVHSASSLIGFPINCTDCLLNGSSFKAEGQVTRDINYGSYVGLNGKTYDNFSNLSVNGNIYQRWEKLFLAPESPIQFDLNGGYLIIGSEEATEEVCGNLAGISYNFNQLLASLRLRGMNFNGAFPRAINDSDFIYKQNYIGTLREVLQQWCADLGYDFYCEGKNFIGINLNRPIDITKITQICDPTTEYGSQFALNTNTAILSYKEENSLANSYRQSVVTANNFARQTKNHNKTAKRYVGLYPLHPIDFNSPSTDTIFRRDLFNNAFRGRKWGNSFDVGSADLDNTLPQLDGRTFRDIDTAIALSNYDDDLRDIYCQDQAIYGATDAEKYSNFKALGMFPLIEVTGEGEKSVAIEAFFGEQGDEISNISLDSRYYKVFIGYYYDKLKQDITSWEKSAAQNMYKFGVATKGLLQHVPYLPYNILQDLSPSAGLYGTNGASYIRVKHTYQPSLDQYYDLYEAPFKDLLLYEGLRNPTDYFNQDLFIGSISNDWGTTQEAFKRNLSLNLSDACAEEFGNEVGYVEAQTDTDKKFQDWRLAMFKPQQNGKIKNFYTDFGTSLEKINNQDLQIDRSVEIYYDINNEESKTCAKLHLFLLTDTRYHPNIEISFDQRGRDFINPVVLQKYLQNEEDSYKSRLEQKTPSICDKSLLQEMCDAFISGRGINDRTDPRYTCVLNDPENTFEEGFNPSYLSSPNSRGLEINIVKNPIRNNDTDKIQSLLEKADDIGQFYYMDIQDEALNIQQQQASLTIIYPISVDPEDWIYYKAIMTSEVNIENRSPEITEIYGAPTNTTFNNSATTKVINNNVDSDLQPQLDPYTNRFLTYLTVVTGNGQILSTVGQYHSFINNLNGYQLTGASKKVDMTLAGTPNFFGDFTQYLSPQYGLNKMSVTVGENGVSTNLSYSDRPPVLPRAESVLNRISPRIK